MIVKFHSFEGTPEKYNRYKDIKTFIICCNPVNEILQRIHYLWNQKDENKPFPVKDKYLFLTRVGRRPSGLLNYGDLVGICLPFTHNHLLCSKSVRNLKLGIRCCQDIHGSPSLALNRCRHCVCELY